MDILGLANPPIKIITFYYFLPYAGTDESLRKSGGILCPIDQWKNPGADLYNYSR